MAKNQEKIKNRNAGKYKNHFPPSLPRQVFVELFESLDTT